MLIEDALEGVKSTLSNYSLTNLKIEILSSCFKGTTCVSIREKIALKLIGCGSCEVFLYRKVWDFNEIRQ